MSTVRLHLAFEEVKHPRDRYGRWRDLSPGVTSLMIRLRKPRPAPLPKPPAGMKTSLITVRRHNGETTTHTAHQASGGYVGHVHEDDPTHFTVLIPTHLGGVEQHTYRTLVEALYALEHGASHAPGPPRKRIRKEAHV